MLGSNWKQRMGIRSASSSKPYCSTRVVTMVSKVMPCSGSTLGRLRYCKLERKGLAVGPNPEYAPQP